MSTNRRLAAIMVADVVGYSRMMEADEAGTLEALKERRKTILEPVVKAHGGRIVKLMGDGVLVEFGSAVNAVKGAVELQKQMAAANDGVDQDKLILLRIGINLGDVIGEGSDIYGDGVNIAAKLEGIASPGGIVVDGASHDQIGSRINVQFKDLGEVQLKNISRPIRAWAISNGVGQRKASEGKGSRLTSIAVLPFNNMSGDPEQDYFADGIAEDVLTELARHRDLAVVSRNSSFAYKGKAINLQAAGSELNADFILEGSVRKAGDRVRITAQLIDSSTGNHVWAERYDRRLDDIFALQDEIVGAILRGFSFNLPRAAAHQKAKDPTASTDAYTAFLQARAAWRSSDESSTFTHLRRALEIDPNYAMALAFMAHLLSYSQFSGTSSNKARNDKQLSQDFAARALAFDAQDPVVLLHVAIAKWMTGDSLVARTLIETAREIMPRDPQIINNQGQILVYCGEHQRGIDLMEESVKQEARLPNPTKMGMAEGYYLAKDYKRALQIYDSIVDIPWYAAIGRAASLAQLGRIDDAKRVTEAAMAMAPSTIDTSEFAQNLAAMCVLKEDAENWLEGFRKMGFCK